MGKLWVQIAKSNRQRDPEATEESKRKNIFDQNKKSPLMEYMNTNLAMFEPGLWKLTYDQIIFGTNKFCEKNVTGGGGFGNVFKGTIHDGKTFAIKKLSQTILLGYCSIGEKKLLVYDYMVKGSLDDWLRNRVASLDWGKCSKIVCGVAHGIAFLHQGFEPNIIHKDIKASNILLSEDFEAKVSDFGLARLISDCESHVSTDVAGTIGYVPSEYGRSGKANEKGDI
ncbi:hypothetical protein WN944_022812 [Citrus x changshan-huyou]|uniref:non-specific serine/threonine protein kinase n=1 Tax=Citrus x changshan-huyou TaxID=2935761 RepID=A0AAP0R3E3_9ROSI